jgi:phosphoribosylglycinamide formyltransferase 1
MAGRIAVLVSGSGSNLQALAEACQRGEVPGSVVGVVGDRPCGGLEWAASVNIPYLLLEPVGFENRDDWSAALRDLVLQVQPDLVVSAGFMRVVAPVFVDAFAGRLINLHPSLLPAFPGAHAVRDALQAGVKVTGSTVHFIDHLVDHGPIIAQEPVRVEPFDGEQALHERIKAVEHVMLPQAVRLILEGRVRIVEGRTEIS